MSCCAFEIYCALCHSSVHKMLLSKNLRTNGTFLLVKHRGLEKNDPSKRPYRFFINDISWQQMFPCDSFCLSFSIETHGQPCFTHKKFRTFSLKINGSKYQLFCAKTKFTTCGCAIPAVICLNRHDGCLSEVALALPFCAQFKPVFWCKFSTKKNPAGCHCRGTKLGERFWPTGLECQMSLVKLVFTPAVRFLA